MPKSLNSRFAFLQTIFFITFCISMAFMVPMLTSLGYKTMHITFIMTGAAITCSLAQPLVGHLCDVIGHERLIVLFCTASPTLYLFMLWKLGTHPAIAALAAALTFASAQSMTGVIDSWASKLKAEGYTLNFSATRSFGSIAYSLSALIFGLLFDRFGIKAAPVALLICFPLMLLALRRIPEPARHGASSKSDFAGAFKSLLAIPIYRLLLMCYFLIMLPFSANITYFPILFEELGGTNSQLGLAFFLMASSEMVSLLLYTRFRRRFKCESLLSAAFLVFGLKNILTALSPGVPMAIAVNLMQFGCYGLLVPGIVDFLSAHIAHKRLSTAQLVANAAGLSISQIAGNFCFGIMADNIGLKPMFFLSSLPAFIGTALWLFGNSRLRHSPDKA